MILLILVIAAMAKLKKLSRKYDYFIRGKDEQDALEQALGYVKKN